MLAAHALIETTCPVEDSSHTLVVSSCLDRVPVHNNSLLVSPSQ